MNSGMAVTLAAALVAAPAVTPAPSPAPESARLVPLGAQPLKEIGHVRALTTFCSSMLDFANVAIRSALSDDLEIVDTVETLEAADPDASVIAKQRLLGTLGEHFLTLRHSAVAGQRAAEALRNGAKDAPTDDQRAKLVDFANAVDGALHRQKVIDDQLSRLIAYLDVHPPVDWVEQYHAQIALQQLTGYRYSPIFNNPDGYLPWTLGDVRLDAVLRFVDEQKPIAADEVVAAERADPAFDGC